MIGASFSVPRWAWLRRVWPAFLVAIALVGLPVAAGLVAGETETVDDAGTVAQPGSLANYLPAETLLYTELPAPERLVQKLLKHPTVATALELDAVKPNLRGPQFLAFKAGLTLVEASLGAQWPDLVADLGGQGLAMAALPGENRFVVLLHARDEVRLKKAAESLLNLSAMQAKNEGQPQPWRIEERGSAKIAIFDGFSMVRSGPRLALANRFEDAEAVVERFGQAAPSHSLAANPAFQTAKQSIQRDYPESDGFLWLNLEQLRETGLAPALTQAVSDNLVAELLFGGWLVALGSNPSAMLVLHLNDSTWRVEALTDYRVEMTMGPREYWFGESGTGRSPQWISPPSLEGATTLQLSAYRDLGQWWLNKESLFIDSVIADLVQADSQLSTIFGGLDFGGEILGAFEPGVQILVSRRPGSNLETAVEPPAGSLQIPGVAIVGQLRQPLQTTRRFKVAFQSVMGFVNLGLAQAGLPQYDVDTRTTDEGCECVSRIWVEEEADLQSPVYSFSPSLLINNGRLVLGSDAAWVRYLANTPQPHGGEETVADAVTSNRTPAPTSANPAVESAVTLNTQLDLDWNIVVHLLTLNRELLVAQNMIENGNSRPVASREIDNLLQALALVSRVNFRWETSADQLRLIGQVDWATTPPAAPVPEERP